MQYYDIDFKMQSSISLPSLPVEIVLIFDSFESLGHKIFFVGGTVRNILQGLPIPLDIDLVTTARPIDTLKILQKLSLGAILNHAKTFGTIGLVCKEHIIEITTIRKDVKCFGRLAEVLFADTLEEDAPRRDFTINAIYLTLQGKVYDFFAGRSDLKKGILRFIGDASCRMKEDYLRILRFFRFISQLRLTYEESDLQQVFDNLSGLKNLSKERITKEIIGIISGINGLHTTRLMQLGNVLEVIYDCQFEIDFNLWNKLKNIFAAEVEVNAKKLSSWIFNENKIIEQKLQIKNEEIYQHAKNQNKYIELILFLLSTSLTSEISIKPLALNSFTAKEIMHIVKNKSIVIAQTICQENNFHLGSNSTNKTEHFDAAVNFLPSQTMDNIGQINHYNNQLKNSKIIFLLEYVLSKRSDKLMAPIIKITNDQLFEQYMAAKSQWLRMAPSGNDVMLAFPKIEKNMIGKVISQCAAIIIEGIEPKSKIELLRMVKI